MNKRAKELPRFVYPVVNGRFYNEVYMIPSAATKIWVRGRIGGGCLHFDIYADVCYDEPTPMYCGRFGLIDICDVVGDDYYLSKDKSLFEAENLIDSDDCRELATMIAYEIARHGEVDCGRLDEHVARVIVPRMTAYYNENKHKQTKS